MLQFYNTFGLLPPVRIDSFNSHHNRQSRQPWQPDRTIALKLLDSTVGQVKAILDDRSDTLAQRGRFQRRRAESGAAAATGRTEAERPTRRHSSFNISFNISFTSSFTSANAIDWLLYRPDGTVET